MNVRDKISDMVDALKENDEELARSLFSDIAKAKSDEINESSHLLRAARRHHKAGARHAKAKVNADQAKRPVVDADRPSTQTNEEVNVVSAGNETNLSGGDLPNAYKDDASKADKTPRKKKKDVYGTGGISAAINSQGNNNSGAGDSGGDAGGAGGAGGDGGGGAGGGAGGAGGGT